MQKKLVSIIVPIYNVANFLDSCISSLIHQSYQNIEIILVDDGSTDSSSNICIRWSAKDKRIRYFKKINNGVSSARNFGINKSDGHYIMFVDSDDYVDRYIVEKYVCDIEKNKTELVISEFNCLDSKMKGKKLSNEVYVLDSYQSCDWLILPRGLHGTVWGKFFVSKVIKDNNISFNEQLKIGEDLLFCFDYLQCIKKVTYDPRAFYYYRIRKNSALNHEIISEKDISLDLLHVFEIMMTCLDQEKSLYNMLACRYVVEGCNILCDSSKFSVFDNAIYLKKHIKKYFFTFLRSNMYGVKTKCSALLKYFFPKTVFKLKYRKNNV